MSRALSARRVAWLGAALLLASFLPVAPSLAQAEGEDDPRRTIRVSGQGSVEAAPDRATVVLGVTTDAQDAAAAMTENSEKMRRLIDALVQAGVARRDISTRSLQLRPRWERPRPQGSSEREIVGYTATNTAEVRVRELDQIGSLVDAAVRAGGNRVQQISFEVSDPGKLLEAARQRAWEDARAKAEQLAKLAGSELGPVLKISESSRGPRPVALEYAQAARADVPVEPGTTAIEAGVDVTWMLLPP
jgi:hypothetical protein